MRSVVVVLPASTCAMIPMLRVRASGKARVELRDGVRCTACSRGTSAAGHERDTEVRTWSCGGQHRELSGLDHTPRECRYLPSPAWGYASFDLASWLLPCCSVGV